MGGQNSTAQCYCRKLIDARFSVSVRFEAKPVSKLPSKVAPKEMSTTESDVKRSEPIAGNPAPVPKRITNAQTVCNEKNEKGKLCNGHLKQLRTAGEASEIHLRGDDVLFKCQTCGTFYMGPPLGHVRDPNKQSRFVEAELSALLQAAGGTLPVVKKDARGVFIMLESGTEHGAAPAKAAAKAAAGPAAAKATTAAPKPAASAVAQPVHKVGANPDRQLFRRSTYAGVKDIGPVAGETFEQKVARLKAVSAGAKQRADEGGGEVVAAAAAEEMPAISAPELSTSESATPAVAASSTPSPQAAHKPTGEADRTLMRRSTYCGVVDTGPTPGETFEQKVARLAAVSAAAKQRADEAG
jgi:hypothetical protein